MSSALLDQMADCLQGIKVVDLSRNLPGPFATRLLADLGAQIVKIEPPQGDPARAFGELFTALNHGKDTQKVDFRDEAGIDAIKEQVKEADVMLDSFRPGVLEAMGLSFSELQALNPKLVMVSITGYGHADGESVTHNWSQKAGHDINFMAMSGALDQLKTAKGGQAMPNIQFADLAGGSDTAVIALLAAVIAAKSTGKGRHINISMTHSLYHHMVMPKSTGKLIEQMTGKKPVPQYDFLGGLLPCYRLYKTSDDRYMAIGSLELKFWQGLCEVLELPELKTKHWQMGVMPNTKDSQAAAQAIADKFASHNLAYWQQVFESADVCVTPVLTLEEARLHPLFAHQDEYGATAGWQ
ncbi:CaiB/BaiF CoA transferase family protein [Psychrobacter sp. ANT_WB68]|uniref:CaiB/BaiF CoA transferase family protein n=1 Tax=Psychrobacter sp. ANT_WB68 TaxID=2597355 RepID=UPI0011F398B6|nr:CaiB/BaiF CoA-transferase family protein [Psychrobacter sp. ANT_WB68]KAA0915661.1 CoA transferase [Psychrobacter sp. ANT_WB68]